MIEPLREYRFPLDDVALCSFRVSLSEIATRLNLPIHPWEEDGLGPARAAGCRLPSGLVVVLEEHDHAIEHLASPGAFAKVDVGEVAARGIDPLVDEILGALSLSRADVDWIQPPEVVEWAREYAERVRRHHAARERRDQEPAE